MVCEDVFEVVEEMPELIGGLSGIHDRKEYPSVAVRAGIEGRVIVDFIVNKLGITDSLYVARGIGGGCDEESLRLIKTTKWDSGRMDGKEKCVRMSIPIVFKLPEPIK